MIKVTMSCLVIFGCVESKPLQIASSPLASSRVALRFSNRGSTKPAIGDVSALAHTSTSPPTSNAIPFISIAANQTLEVDHAALRAIADLPAPVCVMTMSGTARDGQSTFLNMYSQWLRTNWAADGGQSLGFTVGHDLDACTNGAHVRLFRGRGVSTLELLAGLTLSFIGAFELGHLPSYLRRLYCAIVRRGPAFARDRLQLGRTD